MTDFFDWLTAGDLGVGTDRLREQFRLSQEEMRRTTEALAPAFLFAMQGLAADPRRWGEFMRRVASLGPDAADAATPSPNAAVVAQLFGTDLLTEAVARQASVLAGVAPDTIRALMPGLALMTIQTMTRMAGGANFAQPGAWPTDGGGAVAAETLRRAANAVEAFNRPSTEPPAGLPQTAYLERMFADALRGSFPWMTGLPAMTTPRSARTTRAATAGSPAPMPLLAFAPLFDALAASTAARAPETPTDRERAPTVASRPASATRADPFASYSRMLEAGRSAQETYALEMLALFDRYRS